MGVDISLFAKKSQIRLKADRAWVCSYWGSKDPGMRDLDYQFRDPEEGLNLEQATYYLNECLNVNSQMEEIEEYRKEYAKRWLEEMLNFVKKYPEDTFFIMTDAFGQYFDLCDDYLTYDPLNEEEV